MNIASFIGGKTVNLFHTDGTITDDVLVIHADGLGLYANLGGSRVFFPWSAVAYAEVTA